MAWDQWVAFTLLAILGGRMIIGGLRHSPAEECTAPERHGFLVLAMTAVATSLDALAVGVGLAFLQVNILVTAPAIGGASTIMATTGVMVGRFICTVLGKWAEVIGGVVLVGIVCTHFLEHLRLLN